MNLHTAGPRRTRLPCFSHSVSACAQYLTSGFTPPPHRALSFFYCSALMEVSCGARARRSPAGCDAAALKLRHRRRRLRHAPARNSDDMAQLRAPASPAAALSGNSGLARC